MFRSIPITSRFSVSLERTLRVPNDGGTYPLPPGLGSFPVYPRQKLSQVAALVLPEADYYVPMYQSEALWFDFVVPHWLPHAVQIAAGGVNVLTGELHRPKLTAEPQNYLCCPPQPWLDGIRTGAGNVSQFVATSIGTGLTLEEQLGVGRPQGGITIRVVPPRPGLFIEPEPSGFLRSQRRVGLGGGGRIDQKIYPDPHGVDIWDTFQARQIRIQIVSSAHFEAITGWPAPATPVTAEAYARHQLPWYRLYDEPAGDLGVTPALESLRTIPNADPSLHWLPVKGIHPGPRS